MKSPPSTPLATRVTVNALAEDVEIYVSDAGDFDRGPWQIPTFDRAGASARVFTTEHLAWPQDIVFLEDQGVVLVSDPSTNGILRHDANAGDFLDVRQPRQLLARPHRFRSRGAEAPQRRHRPAYRRLTPASDQAGHRWRSDGRNAHTIVSSCRRLRWRASPGAGLRVAEKIRPAACCARARPRRAGGLRGFEPYRRPSPRPPYRRGER